jgi:hypothetical protein
LKIAAGNHIERVGAQPFYSAGSVLRWFRPGVLLSEASRNLSFSQCLGPCPFNLGSPQPASPQNRSHCLVITLTWRGQMRSGSTNLSFYQPFSLCAPYPGRPQPASSRILSFYQCFELSRSHLNRSQSANSRILTFSHCFRVSPLHPGGRQSAIPRSVSHRPLTTGP